MVVIQEDLEEQVVEDRKLQDLVLVLMEQLTQVAVEEVDQLTTLQLVEQVDQV